MLSLDTHDWFQTAFFCSHDIFTSYSLCAVCKISTNYVMSSYLKKYDSLCAQTYQIAECTVSYSIYFLFIHILNKCFICVKYYNKISSSNVHSFYSLLLSFFDIFFDIFSRSSLSLASAHLSKLPYSRHKLNDMQKHPFWLRKYDMFTIGVQLSLSYYGY